MIGQAYYCGELVSVIDVVWNQTKNRNDYMISWSGPVWVSEDELSRIVYLVSA